MGVGAAQDLADEHAGGNEVGTEVGPARDLVHPVRADRPGADPLVCPITPIHGQAAPRISAAASITARTTLS